MSRRSASLAAYKRFQMIDWLVENIQDKIARKYHASLAHHQQGGPAYTQEQWDEINSTRDDSLMLIELLEAIKDHLPATKRQSAKPLTRSEYRTVGEELLPFIAKRMVQLTHKQQHALAKDLDKVYRHVAEVVEFLRWESTGQYDKTYYQPPQKQETSSNQPETPSEPERVVGLSILRPVRDESDLDLGHVPGMIDLDLDPTPTPA